MYTTTELTLLFVMGVALVLVGIIGYVLRLTAHMGAAPSDNAAGSRATAPEKFAPYLEELDGPQLDALHNLHAPSSFHPLLTHDHAKEQLV